MGGWRWIFIVKRMSTVHIDALITWLLLESPGRATFLTVGEKAYIKDRFVANVGSTAEKVRIQSPFK